MSSDANQIPTAQVVESNGNTQAATADGHETAHVLFLDVVGFTKLRSPKQRFVLGKLQDIVRATTDFRKDKEEKKLITLPTGDGMALVFLTSKGSSGKAVSCAEEITQSVLAHNKTTNEDDAKIHVRIGIHTGNVVQVQDVNDQANVAGEGINTAQRVMDCGDVGHILLSSVAFRLLPDEPDRTGQFKSLGIVRVKHDQEINLFSWCRDEIGNEEMPQKILLEKKKEEEQQAEILRRVQKGLREAAQISMWKKVAAVGLVVLLMLLTALITRAIVAPKQNPPTSLAVQPFQPKMSENYCSRAVSQAFTEEFTRSFREQTPAITVKQNSVIAPGSPIPSADEIGKQLESRYVLTGSVECDDSNVVKSPDVFPNFNVAVHAELYDRDRSKVIWSTPESSSTPFNQQLLTLQQSMFEAMADKMGVDPLKDPTLGNAANAHWYYLLGRYWSLRRASAKVEDKKDFAQKAIDSYGLARKSGVPRYNALALAGLADIAIATAGAGNELKDARREALDKALEAAEVGEDLAEKYPKIGIEKDLAQAYAAIGTEKWWLERDFLAALVAFRLAIKLNPDLADAHKRYSACLVALGKFDKADREIKLALEIERYSTVFQLTSGQNLFFAREYGKAITRLRDLIRIDPKNVDVAAYRFLAMAYAENRQNQEAFDELKSFKSADDSDLLSVRAYVLARLNRSTEAREIAKQLERLWEENQSKERKVDVSPYNIAVIYAAMPEKQEDCLKWLTRAIDKGDPRVAWLKVDPRFDYLRNTNTYKQEFDKRLQAARLPL